MRGARFLLAASIALAMAGCARQPQYAQQGGPQTNAPAAARMYSSSPAYAQQAYEQPPPLPAESVSGNNRGLFSSWPASPVYAAPAVRTPVYAAQPIPQPAGTGGPYVAPPYIYTSAPAPARPVSEPAYTLDTGDKVRVVVFGQDGISNSYLVDVSGKVNLSLIGAVPARGLTNQQLAAAIAARLKQGFIREPHVSVEVETYRPFFILGEVTTPGQYPYVANMTAETAVAIAGGFAPRAYKKTVELTRKGSGQIHVEVPLDYPVRPGDTIVVKERWF
jgi:polysaccharide biosynthesis/export protein